ncbi:craniofacial development protein 2-like [Mobula hypostoma]|uniref:craniofacial development protein 2-like n=1 Tax=Mobula hypostoma TaxID=723540 RepID=UPI002FC3C095
MVKLTKWVTQQQRQEDLQGNSEDTSLGRVDSRQQGIPDHHQATAHKIKVTQKKSIATWNVRTLYQAERLDNVINEMERLKINIMGIREVHWIGAGTCQNRNKTLIYSCGTSHTNRVGILMDENMAKSVLGHWAISERVLLVRFRGQPFDLATTDGTNKDIQRFVDKFCEELEQAKNGCKSQDIVIVMGDLNAKVGQCADGNTTGKFGLGERNERGEKWVEWCKMNNQVIMNTYFKNHPRRLWTWKSPGDNTRNQSDFITINQRFRNSVTQCKTYPGADCNSDHNPVACHVKVKFKKLKKQKPEQSLDYLQLIKEETLRQKFTIEVRNRFQSPEIESVEDDSNHVEMKFNSLMDALVESAKSVIPKKGKSTKNKRMTDEIKNLMEESKSKRV